MQVITCYQAVRSSSLLVQPPSSLSAFHAARCLVCQAPLSVHFGSHICDWSPHSAVILDFEILSGFFHLRYQLRMTKFVSLSNLSDSICRRFNLEHPWTCHCRSSCRIGARICMMVLTHYLVRSLVCWHIRAAPSEQCCRLLSGIVANHRISYSNLLLEGQECKHRGSL